MRQRPARRAAAHAEPGLQREIVELVDDAVDVVGQFGAARRHLLVIGQHLGDAVAQPGMLVDAEAPVAEAVERLAVRAREGPARLAPGIGEEFQRPAGRNAGVKLAQRPGRDIARVHEQRFAGGGALLVDREKPGPLHIDFAAHFEQFRPVRAGEMRRAQCELSGYSRSRPRRSRRRRASRRARAFRPRSAVKPTARRSSARPSPRPHPRRRAPDPPGGGRNCGLWRRNRAHPVRRRRCRATASACCA